MAATRLTVLESSLLAGAAGLEEAEAELLGSGGEMELPASVDATAALLGGSTMVGSTVLRAANRRSVLL